MCPPEDNNRFDCPGAISAASTGIGILLGALIGGGGGGAVCAAGGPAALACAGTGGTLGAAKGGTIGFAVGAAIEGLFFSRSEDFGDKDPQDQLEDISRTQEDLRRVGQGEKIRSIRKSIQRALKDAKDNFEELLDELDDIFRGGGGSGGGGGGSGS